MKSFLCVNRWVNDNYNNQTEMCCKFKRGKDGKYEPIDIICGYEIEDGILYLKINLEDFQKTYIYTFEFDKNAPNDKWIECKMTSDLNETSDKLNFQKTYEYKMIRDKSGYKKDWTEFKYTFDLNEAIDKENSSENLDEIKVRIFTCWCSDENCCSHKNSKFPLFSNKSDQIAN